MLTSSPPKGQARFQRQFRLLRRENPRIACALERVSHRRWRVLRLPIAILLVMGGIFSILPILGLWMLPAGLFLMAIDIPPLQRPVGWLLVKIRVLLRRTGKSRKKSSQD